MNLPSDAIGIQPGLLVGNLGLWTSRTNRRMSAITFGITGFGQKVNIVHRVALEKINAIRDDIIGRQTVSWSRHVYPLVAALQEAGHEGKGYEIALAEAKTADQQITELTAEVERLTQICKSHDLTIKQLQGDD